MVQDTMDDVEGHHLKVVFVGDAQVGKTALIQRFIANQLPGMYLPTGFEKYPAALDVGGLHFFTTIWDTSGSPTYDTVRPLVYQDTDVFVLCFNLGDWYTLHNVLNKWYPEVRKFCTNPKVPIVLVGCQNDQRFVENLYAPFHVADEIKRRVVYTEEAMDVSRQMGAVTYVETCAFNPVTVREAIEVAALAGQGKLHKRCTSLFGLGKHLSLSSSSTVSSPSSSGCSDGLSSSASSKLKSSTSSTHLLTRHRSLFKLRKCKSKAELQMDSSSTSSASKKSCLIM